MPISRIKTDGIQDDAITSAKIGDTNIGTADIADSSVTTAKIAAGAVTSAKLDTNIDIAGDFTVGNDLTVGDRVTIEQAARAGVNEIRSYNNSASSYMELHFDASSFRFYDSANGTYSSSTEALRVNDSGVSFDAGSNYLDDYEEGTFTPTIFGTTGGTPVNGSGFYTKIGNTVKTTIQFTNVNMSGHTGTLRIDGLPFASANQNEVAAVPMTYNVAITGTDKYNIGFISDNSTNITYYRIRDLSSWTGTPVPTGSTVYLNSTFTYTTSA